MDYDQESNKERALSDVEKLFFSMQKTFGGKSSWDNLDLNAKHVFINSVNNIRAICSL